MARAALTRADKAWTMSLRSGYSIGIGFYTDPEVAFPGAELCLRSLRETKGVRVGLT